MAQIKKHVNQSQRHKPKGVSHKQFVKVHWPYIPVLLALLIFLSFGVPSGRLKAAARHPLGKVLDYATSMSVSGLLADTNAQREANGVTSLSLNAKLDDAAQACANDMAARDYWSHYTPDGNPPWIWVTNEGYAYQKLGQNLATGFSDEQSTINGWMASPPHRENLLDPAFSEVGFGFANSANYTAAGGGPMTIVVAFYGEPLAPAPAPVAHVSPPPAAPVVQSTPTPVPSTTTSPSPPPAAAASQKPAPKPAKPSQKPVTTQSPVPSGVTLSLRTSNAQDAFAKLPNSDFATSFATIAMFAAIGLWLSRHLLTLRKVLLKGEAYIVHHPLLDVCLVSLALIAYLLSRTAGFIQ